jgi:polyhydroxybutyrate depolymerase
MRLARLVAIGLVLVLGAAVLGSCRAKARVDAPRTEQAAATATATAAAAGAQPASAGCGSAAPHAAGASDETIDVAAVQRTYILRVPPGYDGSRPVPLVVNLHGAGSNAREQNFYSGFANKADAEGFVLLAPNALGTPASWNFVGLPREADDLAFVAAMLDRAESGLCIDTSRVYAAGISSGAAMSVALACSMQDRIAAIAPVAGSWYPPGCPKDHPMPVISFHGTDDPVVKYGGGEGAAIIPTPPVEQTAAKWAAADGCSATPAVTQPSEHIRVTAYTGCAGGVAVTLYTIVGGGHTWPGARVGIDILGATTQEVNATDEIWRFFTSQPALVR